VRPGDVITIKAGVMHSFNNPGTVTATMVEVLGKAPAPPAKPQEVATRWTVPRTPDGQPDLQGIWDYRTATPVERPRELAGREFLTDEEIAAFERRAAAREDGRPPEDARATPSVHPPWWLDYGKQVVGTRRSSLVIDPPDGRVPPLTAEAQKRAADGRAARAGRGPADGPEDRSLWERCITRGLPEGMLPAGSNNNLQLVQTAGYVVIFSEMIHDARIVPLDGRAAAPQSIRRWTGDSRGRWDGDTLVVETTNFSDKTSFRGSGSNLRVTERFTRIDADTIEYRFTVEDPTTWTRPWTATFPMVKSEGPMYEYACHEGNYRLKHILGNARAEEQSAEGAKR
jgi:hypothetical protein